MLTSLPPLKISYKKINYNVWKVKFNLQMEKQNMNIVVKKMMVRECGSIMKYSTITKVEMFSDTHKHFK